MSKKMTRKQLRTKLVQQLIKAEYEELRDKQDDEGYINWLVPTYDNGYDNEELEQIIPMIDKFEIKGNFVIFDLLLFGYGIRNTIKLDVSNLEYYYDKEYKMPNVIELKDKIEDHDTYIMYCKALDFPEYLTWYMYWRINYKYLNKMDLVTKTLTSKGYKVKNDYYKIEVEKGNYVYHLNMLALYEKLLKSDYKKQIPQLERVGRAGDKTKNGKIHIKTDEEEKRHFENVRKVREFEKDTENQIKSIMLPVMAETLRNI